MNNKTILIAGGGTAGWLTALFCAKHFPNDVIKLVESEEIGILGAGEGSTPALIDFLNLVEIDVLDLIKHTKSTIKSGISFENWNGDNKKYFHSFFNNHIYLRGFSCKPFYNFDDPACWDLYLRQIIGKELDMHEYIYTARAAYENKLPVSQLNEELFSSYSLHFDARLLAKFLRQTAEQRGVIRLEGKIESIQNNEHGYVTSVCLDSGTNLNSDFVFDCTGFARLFIGKHFQSKWKDYSKHLPVDSAIPYFPKVDEDHIIPYTRAIAMQYGWQWQIPLQHRYGAGYVFDSTMISEDQAKRELDLFVGYEVESPKTFKFKAGRYENVWIKNVMAVGLSTGFTEPLEATAIMSLVMQLINFKNYIPSMYDKDDCKRNEFNFMVGNGSDDLMYFLYLHYLTKRKDSEFWSKFKERTEVPEIFKPILEIIQLGKFDRFTLNNLPSFKHCGFSTAGYYMVAHGLGLFDTRQFAIYNENLKLDQRLEPSLKSYKERIQELCNISYDHKEWINKIIQDK